jgi:hypothetical protein
MTCTGRRVVDPASPLRASQPPPAPDEPREVAKSRDCQRGRAVILFRKLSGEVAVERRPERVVIFGNGCLRQDAAHRRRPDANNRTRQLSLPVESRERLRVVVRAVGRGHVRENAPVCRVELVDEGEKLGVGLLGGGRQRVNARGKVTIILSHKGAPFAVG